RRLSRLANLREPLLRHPFDERLERLLNDRSDISIRYTMAQEVLCLAKLVATGAARGELELEGLLRERLDDGPMLVAPRGGGRFLADDRRDGRLRRETRDQLFDLARGLASGL